MWEKNINFAHVRVNPYKMEKIIFCILVSDKNTHDLATYIHLSIWLFKAHKVVQSTQSINSGSLQKDVSFNQKYL